MEVKQRIMPVASAKSPDDILCEEEHDAIWLKELFLAAKSLNASDIHIKPILEPCSWNIELEAKLRINGEKRFYGKLKDNDVVKAVLGKIKVLARFDLSTDETCQDQAFSLKLTRCRYRANLMPTELGEAFVLRIIKTDEIPRLGNLGLSESLKTDYKAALRRKRGLILFTGETGSGKSTTVQAGLMEVDRCKKEVLAIEHPSERQLEDVKHIGISRHVSWSDSITAAMRADPDIIYVGEIRDRESAQLALAAANTGHLVVSTLHAARVSGIFARFADWGIERRILAENLIFATNQVLVKKICPNCRIKLNSHSYSKGAGCENCDAGIVGRVPIIEYTFLPSPTKILNFCKDDFEQTELKTTFYNEASRLVSLGVISYEELELWEPVARKSQAAARKEAGNLSIPSLEYGEALLSGIGKTSQKSLSHSH